VTGKLEDPAHNPTRRTFLRGRPGRETVHVRLPWLATHRFVDGCTRCGECLAACPEKIIVPSTGGFPSIDFSRGECTFCGACADACPASLFDRSRAEPWKFKALISGDCLAKRHIMCRSCEDACVQNAIAFKLAPGRLPSPEIYIANCTGCGGCVSVCPENAISIQ
jgi:ferredoxin-type protein NapF